MPDFLTVKDVAERFEVSDRTIRYWINKGYIVPSYRLGRVYKFTETDLENFINNNKFNNEKGE